MILGFKTMFPWGKPTSFLDKIAYGIKIHTLREGNRWKAGQPIHFATGVRTKNYVNFTKGICKSTQSVIIANVPGIGVPFVYVDGRRLTYNESTFFASYDGFDSIEDFARWFSKKDVYVLQLIHWTDFKY